MRIIYFILFFPLLALSVDADWQSYENDLRNSANSNETGYFPLFRRNKKLAYQLYGITEEEKKIIEENLK